MTDAPRWQAEELETQRSFLRALARELVRCEATAEDVVQDAFVLALERPPANPGTMRAWLGRVVRNLALNRVRGESRRGARERSVARDESAPAPDEALASLALQRRVIESVQALAEPYRTTLWLRFHEGLAPGAIAAREDTTKKTVEARLTRGLALVRARLDRESGGDRARWLSGMFALARGARAPWIATWIGVGAMKQLVLAGLALIVLGLMWELAPRARPPLAHAVADQAPIERDGSVVEETLARDEHREAQPPVADPGAGSEAHGALRIRVRWADGTPAAEIGLFVFPEADPLGARSVVRVRSDAQGTARVEALHPGPVRIEADRGGERTVAVVEGTETEAELELARGIDLEGSVTDASGAPLAGAEILLVASAADWLSTRVVGATRADGSYRVRAVSRSFSVSARTAQLVPALLEPLTRWSDGETARIDFVLGESGPGLRGIVLDAEGAPIAGALVAAGDPQGYAVASTEQPGAFQPARGMRVVESGADGRFDVRGLADAFGLPIAVQAQGRPIAVANVPAASEATSFVEIRLEAPRVLSGTVRDPAGAPIPRALLAVVALRGTVARDIPFALPRCVADGDGLYRLDLLPDGPLALRIDPPAGSALGHTLLELAPGPGATTLDLVLSADDTLRGRVEAPAHTSTDGWYVRAWSENGVGRMLRGALRADASFVLQGCSEPPYVLELDAATNRPLLRLRQVGPGRELVLRPEPLGTLSGTFEDAAHRLPAGVRPEIALSGRPDVGGEPTWSDDATFFFDQLAPGSYHLTIRHGEELLQSLGVVLAPGEQRELGRLTSGAPGSMRVEFDSWPSGGFSGSILDRSFTDVASLDDLDGSLGVAELPPGTWYLAIWATGSGQICAPFEIRPGERTRVRLAFEPGVERTLLFPLRTSAGEWDHLHVAVRSASGELRAVRELERLALPRASAPGVLVTLPVGTFTVEAATDTGLAARGTFDVPALVAQDAPLSFEMR